jgi:hypothetical protein
VPSTSDSLSRDVLPELVDEVVLETGPREVGPAERQVAAGLGIGLADLLRRHLAHHGAFRSGLDAARAPSGPEPVSDFNPCPESTPG